MTNAEARFNKSHIRKVYACLAVTCHLHFWQNDRDFLRATVVTQGWNRYRNKSQHRKSTLEKKILPPFQQGFEPATFQSWVRRSNHWAIPAPGNYMGKEVYFYSFWVTCKLNTMMQIQHQYKRYQPVMLKHPTFWWPFCMKKSIAFCLFDVFFHSQLVHN